MNTRDVAVWLYGSAARGDADSMSDLDVLVVSDTSLNVERLELPANASRSVYTWGEFEALRRVGSLFLHHLRIEGQPLLGCGAGVERSRTIIQDVGPYRGHRRDLEGFQLVLDDVFAAENHGSTPEYELGVLGTLARHAAILGCYLLGQPCFSRNRVFDVACGGFGMPPQVAVQLGNLYAYRMVLEGRTNSVVPGNWDDVDIALKCVSTFVNHVRKSADEYDRSMS